MSNFLATQPFLRVAAALSATWLFQAGGAAAQTPPIVEIEPAEGEFSQATIDVRIKWCSGLSLDASSRSIRLNFVDQTTSFTYTTPPPEPCEVGTYQAESVGTITLEEGENHFAASIRDINGNLGRTTTSYTFTVPPPPTVDVSMNAGARIAPSACVTTGAGPYGMFQCGELVTTIMMPAFRSMTRERTMTLLYRSGGARPFPVVRADIGSSAATPPDSIRVALAVNGSTVASHSYSASLPLGTLERRVAVGFNATVAGLSTGVYPYTMEATSYFGTAGAGPATASGELIVVHRGASPYGAGWSIAGVEELHPMTVNGRNVQLVIGGNGGAAVYEQADTNRWIAPEGGYRDTLIHELTTPPDGAQNWYYTRTLLDGTKLFYRDGNVRFVRDRSGNSVEYFYTASGPGAPLSYVRIAPRPANLRYNFYYTAAKLDSIVDPAGRVLEVDIPSTRLVSARQPGIAQPISFDYEPTYNRLSTITNTRGHATTYAYLGPTGLLVSATLPATITGQGVIAFTPPGAQGYAAAATGNTMAAATAEDILIDGPRTDVTDVSKFWINQFGAPVRIVGPVGDTTDLQYDTDAPLRASRVRFPEGRVLVFEFDSLGRVLWAVDSTHSSTFGMTPDTVTYEYGDSATVDKPTRIVLPRAPGVHDALTYKYDAAGRPDTIIAENGHRTRLTYNTRGQVQWVREDAVMSWIDASNPRSPATLATRIFYNANGNVDSVRTPLLHTTRYRMDVAGNVRMVVNALGDSVGHSFDAMNRDTLIQQFDSAATYRTRMAYDSEGNRISLTDALNRVRQWAFDALDQDTAMTDELGRVERRFYELAGNLARRTNRQNDTTAYAYDAANRLIRKVLGEIKVDSSAESTECSVSGYPPCEQLANTVLVPVDTAFFTLDREGRIRKAENRHAVVTRGYTREGTIAGDTLVLKFLGNQTHINEYIYDRGGRRANMTTTTPWWTGRTYTYTYADGGILSGIASSTGHSVAFRTDGLGRRDSIAFSGGAWSRFRYDKEGRVREIYAYHASAPTPQRVDLRWTEYDGLGQPIELEDRDPDIVPAPLKRTWVYDRRSQLWQSSRSDAGVHPFRYDSAGNIRWEAPQGTQTNPQPDSTLFQLYAGTNRVSKRTDIVGSSQVVRDFGYDYNGNTVIDLDFLRPESWGELQGTKVTTGLWQWYDSEERLTEVRAVSITYPAEGASYETRDTVRYRYDALGRLLHRGTALSGELTTTYDGGNVLRVGRTEILAGLGTDDPLIAIADPGGTQICGAAAAVFIAHGGRLYNFLNASTGADCEEGAWSGVANHAGAIANSHEFGLSRSQDPTGLSYFRNRFYNAGTGRFTQEDPIGFSADFNLYAYSRNNPAAFVDPFGLCKTDKAGKDLDPECRATVNMLRNAAENAETDDGRQEFAKAADALDEYTGDVVWVSAPTLTNARDGNFWGGDANEYRLRLNVSLMPGDFLLAAVHESFHIPPGGGLGGSPLEHVTINRAVARAFSGMSKLHRATADQYDYLLRLRGYIK